MNEKRKKWVHLFTQSGYIQPTVTEVFIDLRYEKSDTENFKRATEFVSHCLEKLPRSEFALEENWQKQISTHGLWTKKVSPSSNICFI